MKYGVMVGNKNKTVDLIDTDAIEYCFELDIRAFVSHYGLKIRLSSRPQYITDIYAITASKTRYFYKMIDPHSVNMCIVSNDEDATILVDVEKINFTIEDLDYIADLIKSTIVFDKY